MQRERMPKAEKHRFLEKNKEAIIKDLGEMLPKEVREKWGIGATTLFGLRRRWGLMSQGSAPGGDTKVEGSQGLEERKEANGPAVVKLVLSPVASPAGKSRVKITIEVE